MLRCTILLFISLIYKYAGMSPYDLKAACLQMSQTILRKSKLEKNVQRFKKSKKIEIIILGMATNTKINTRVLGHFSDRVLGYSDEFQ
jgi:hypothetical protein